MRCLKFSLSLLVAVLLIGSSDLKAGCPTSTPDNPTIPWQGELSYNAILGGGCLTKVYYCWRIIPGSPTRYDYVVTAVEPLDFTSPCGDYDWEWYIENAQRQITSDNPKGFPCPPCPNFVAQYYSVAGTCWQIKNVNPNPEGTPWWVSALCDETGWCMQGQLVCCDPVTGYRTIISQGDYVAVSSPCSVGWPTQLNSILSTTIEYDNTCYYTDPCDD